MLPFMIHPSWNRKRIAASLRRRNGRILWRGRVSQCRVWRYLMMRFLDSFRPVDRQLVHEFRVPDPEVLVRVILWQVQATVSNLSRLDDVADVHGNLSSDATRLRTDLSRSQKSNHQHRQIHCATGAVAHRGP